MNNRRVILPNIVTGCNLLFGIFALMLVLTEDYAMACICIFIAMLFDFLDGQVARWQQATSQFGMEFDSLSDLVSFGIAPGLMGFAAYMREMDEIGVFICAVYMLACGIRLAKFNVLASKPTGKKIFYGLPSPAAAGFVCSTLLLLNKFDNALIVKLFPLSVLGAGILMVSNVKYPVPMSFLFFLKHRITGLPRVIFIGVFAFLFVSHAEILMYSVFSIYMITGIIRTAFSTKTVRYSVPIQAQSETILRKSRWNNRSK
ncbi:MAG: CDP-diacylglycerol--serine O-phosphatidyltransferase [Candidatus Auribacterota bacterium]|jgi:CDP-diacylglycerol--serine O-phosphatidyltransferase|nr:CDP-diacylglycerol--serine O-phosphatidyltransferase [Candidatus Auribacterota bacterium]